MEQLNVQSEEQISPNKYNHLNTVTKTSKYLAMILFIALPFVGGYIGYELNNPVTTDLATGLPSEIVPAIELSSGSMEEDSLPMTLLSRIDELNLHFNGNQNTPAEIYSILESERNICDYIKKEQLSLDIGSKYGTYELILDSFTVHLEERSKVDYENGPCTSVHFTYHFLTLGDLTLTGRLVANDPSAVLMGNGFTLSSESKQRVPEEFATMFLDNSILSALRASEGVSDGSDVYLAYDVDFSVSSFKVEAPYNKGGSPFEFNGVLTKAQRFTP